MCEMCTKTLIEVYYDIVTSHRGIFYTMFSKNT